MNSRNKFQEVKSGGTIEQINLVLYEKVLRRYYSLCAQPDLSEAEADCIETILEQAESDELLSFFLTEIDYLVGQTLGLYDEKHIRSYRDQQAWLREHLDRLNPGEIEYHRELQKWLQKIGWYKGPLDGVAGKDFRQAVEGFQRSRQLAVDGIVGPQTLRTLIKEEPEAETLPRFIPDIDDIVQLAQLERCLENSDKTPRSKQECPPSKNQQG
jgi:hypothetical protein